MKANHQHRTGDVAQSYFKRRRFLLRASSPSRRPRTQQMMTILAIVGTVLLLWSQPVTAASTITEFKVPSPGIPQGITAGSDGNLWFTLFYDNEVGRVTTKGAVTIFRLNATQNSATYITAGPDGALWLTLLNDVGGSTTNQIGRLTTKGALTMFRVPKASYIWDITVGPDNNLYFTDGASSVWRVTTKGQFTQFHFNDSSGYPYQITKGPDGNLWFTDRGHEIVKMSTSGKFTTFAIPTSNGSADDIATGPDGNLWFTLDGTDASRIGRITPSGVITEFTLPNPNDYLFMGGITAGPDGNLWFTYADWTTNVNAIGRITPTGAITLTPTPTANSGPTDITAGPDGAMWFTEGAGNVGRITTH